jgi:hypothetical protein
MNDHKASAMTNLANHLSTHGDWILNHLEPGIQSPEIHGTPFFGLASRRQTLAASNEELKHPLGSFESFNDAVVQHILDFFFQNMFVLGKTV